MTYPLGGIDEVHLQLSYKMLSNVEALMAAASLPPQCQGARCQLENQGNIDTGMSSPQCPLEKSFFFGAKFHKK
jgi:hypothetical protein